MRHRPTIEQVHQLLPVLRSDEAAHRIASWIGRLRWRDPPTDEALRAAGRGFLELMREGRAPGDGGGPLPTSIVGQVMIRYGSGRRSLTKNQAYYLLAKFADKDERGRYQLNEIALADMDLEMSVRRLRQIAKRRLVEGGKSPRAADRWVERNLPTAETVRVQRQPIQEPVDTRDPAALEQAVAAIEAADPALVRRVVPTNVPTTVGSLADNRGHRRT